MSFLKDDEFIILISLNPFMADYIRDIHVLTVDERKRFVEAGSQSILEYPVWEFMNPSPTDGGMTWFHSTSRSRACVLLKPEPPQRRTPIHGLHYQSGSAPMLLGCPCAGKSQERQQRPPSMTACRSLEPEGDRCRPAAEGIFRWCVFPLGDTGSLYRSPE